VRHSWKNAAAGAAAAGLLVLLVMVGCSKTSASFRELKAEHALADSLVRGFTPTNPESLAKVVTLAREKTKKFLVNHKDDIPAAILFVKLRLAEEALTPHPEPPADSTGAPVDHFARAVRSKARVADCVQILEHASTVDPKSAEVYYWKSLVYGLWEPIFEKQAIDPTRSQLPQAVAAATKAVALAPDSANYRTALASYQMLGGDDAAALKTLRAGKDPSNATLLILSDWEKFPLPPGAAYSARESAGIAEWMAASGLDDTNARVRAYWVPVPQGAIRAFYEKNWNGLYWMSQKQAQKNGEKWSFGSAAVMIDGSGYRAIHEADLKNPAMAGAQGISIQIREVRNMQAKGREAVPFPVGDVVCELLLTNHRRAR
jgi:hypothetical protein